MRKKKALFLDRDGIIVNEDQVDSYEKIIWIPHVFQSLARIRRESDFEFVMVSNQDGVGTPSFPYEDYVKCQNRIISTLEGEDVYFDDINIDFSLPEDNCPTRKPGIKMIEAYADGSYDLDASFMIGDRLTDMLLAKNIGCRGIWFAPEDASLPEEYEGTVALVSDNWIRIADFLLNSGIRTHRTASLSRDTAETGISLSLDLDGTGKGEMETGIPFFDHMLAQIIKHSRIDVTAFSFSGDLEVDEHHSVEDLAIVFGSLIKQALGDKRGIERYGYEVLTMDDVVATAALDFSSRPELIYQVQFQREYIGSFPTEMVEHFFRSFSSASGSNVYISCTSGNAHHMAEAVFKAFARALRNAVKRIPGATELPSTKGAL